MASESARAGLRRSIAGLNLRTMWPRIFLIALCLAAAPRARAWGREGHEAIGTLAAELLHPNTKLRVKKILGAEDLATASVWLDEVRSASRGTGPLAGDKEAIAFAHKFPDNSKWHFTNFPLGADAYSDGSRFASPDDAIHTIRASIAVLEGRSTRFAPAQALRVLAHVVEDVHQPLHVGGGFFDLQDPAAPKLVTAPGSVNGKAEDLGGNKVLVGRGRFDNLHAYWDDALVEHVAATGNSEKLAAHLHHVVNLTAWKTPGDYHAWAELWATDSLHEAAQAYHGLVFTAAKMASGKSVESIDAELPKDYEAVQKLRAQTQLAKAAVHLADLLNALDWKVP